MINKPLEASIFTVFGLFDEPPIGIGVEVHQRRIWGNKKSIFPCTIYFTMERKELVLILYTKHIKNVAGISETCDYFCLLRVVP